MNLIETMAKHAITVKAEFIPFSRSRHAKDDNGKSPDKRTLNWSVTLYIGDRAIVTTDYSAGIGHCPSYKQMARWTLDYSRLIEFETENGHTAKRAENISWISKGKAILPDSTGVVASLMLDSSVLDSSVLDYTGFEQWALEFDYDYDSDSRSAEKIYQACMEIALQVRNGLPDMVFRELQEAASEY